MDLGPGKGFCTFPLSKMVGDQGIIYAADIQKKMLDIIELKAKKKNVRNIRTFNITENGFNMDIAFDFILMFWMLHEVREKEMLFEDIKRMLKDSGKILIVEPIIHVSNKKFKRILEIATRIGFLTIDYPKISVSRSALLTKG